MTALRALHLLVRREGGGTETNVRKLVKAVPEFEAFALEQVLGWPLRWRRLPRLIGELRRIDADVVFCYGITAHLVAALTWPRGRPLVGSIRCESDFEGVKGCLQRAISWRFSCWVSNSKAALHGREGIVIYNGIEEPAQELPMFPDLPRPVFGILARGHPKKRHRFAVKLWERLGKPGSMVFAGSLPHDLKRHAEQAGVLCPGHVDPGPLLRSLDLLLVPSEAEGIPTAMLEAMVRGVPCLATPAGGIPELIEHERTSFLLPRREWQSFLESTDWNALAPIGEAARAHVLKNFSFDRMVQEFQAVTRSLAR